MKNQRQNSKDRGVAFYIKNNLQFTVINKLAFMNEKVFESIFVKIELKHATITCGTTYRLPMTDSTSNQQFATNSSSALNNLKPNTKCCIYEDFRYHFSQSGNR